MSTENDKPSIADLQAFDPCRGGDCCEQARAMLIAAAPVLLEIAATALALREQKQVAALARFRVYASLNKNAVPSDENYAASDVEDSKLARCREAHLAALSKVRP